MVFITGGSSGIGRCLGELFAQRGWTVGLIARGEVGLLDAACAARTAGGEVDISVADVSQADTLSHAAEALAGKLGPPDVWINCAGNGVFGQFGAVPRDHFDHVTAVTYTGTVNGCRTALNLMAARGTGTIVNVCSAMAFHGMPMMTSYAGAKAAVRAFAQALRAELRMAGSGVRVVTVFPPAVNTPFFSHAVSHAGCPARPAPPVYRTRVIAAGIYHAVTKGGAEVIISGTVSLFRFAAAFSPELIAWCMTRLGFDRQSTSDPEALPPSVDTLFAPSRLPSGIDGPFSHKARSRSWHLAVKTVLTAFRRDRSRAP